MQQFVIDISNYAHQFNPNFILIPQNGIELAFEGVSNDSPLHSAYLSAIQGFGVEELFYFGTYAPDSYRLNMLRQLKPHKPIMVSEYVDKDEWMDDACQANANEGFLCFPRNSSNYYYIHIPSIGMGENSNDIEQLDQAQNYLYLINSEQFQSKESMLDAIAATNYDVVLIDLFFNGDDPFLPAQVEQLKTKANGGKRLVISYVSIGSAEKYRYYWKKGWGHHHPLWLKKKYDGYPDEFWVKFWKKEWQDIIFGNDNSYIKKIIDAGFDGAYLDNVEAYYSLYYND